MNILKTLLTGAFTVSVCIAQGSSGSTTVKDADGNVYKTVKIGNQVWSVENLRTTKYNDGTPIPLVKDSAAWVALKTPGYCYYGNTTNADSIKKFGVLYNWYAVDTKKLAPIGWHVPSDVEWDTLQNYLIANGYNWDGTKTGNKIGKSLASKTEWQSYVQDEENIDKSEGQIGNDLTNNNSSGFSALPGGLRYVDGDFMDQGSYGAWWSATESGAPFAWARTLTYDYGSLNRHKAKICGYSVRLLRD